MLNLGFNCKFTIKQAELLAELFNSFEVFQPETNADTIAALFACRLKNPLVVRNARILCYIMDQLSQKLMITNLWQTEAEKQGCFVSVKGKPISRHTLSSAKYCAVKFDTLSLNKHLIEDYISTLKKFTISKKNLAK